MPLANGNGKHEGIIDDMRPEYVFHLFLYFAGTEDVLKLPIIPVIIQETIGGIQDKAGIIFPGQPDCFPDLLPGHPFCIYRLQF